MRVRRAALRFLSFDLAEVENQPLEAVVLENQSMVPVLLTQEEAKEMRDRGQIMSVRKAHEKLSAVRAEMTRLRDWVTPVDLTGCDFDWKRYLANRSDAMLEEVVGPGVTSAELRFVNTTDHNTKQHRFDFVFHRVDRLAVRLHPQTTNRESVPIVGEMALWVIGEEVPPAVPAVLRPVLQNQVGEVSAAASQHTSATHLYENYSQSDLISRAQAHEYLKHATEAWTPGEEFKRILTSGSEWNWRLYLASSQWGKELLADGVAEFWRVWHGRGQHGRAVFYCKTQDDRELVIRPFAKPECSEDLHAGIRWHV